MPWEDDKARATPTGRLLAGGQPVLPLPGTGPVGALGRFTGQAATAAGGAGAVGARR